MKNFMLVWLLQWNTQIPWKIELIKTDPRKRRTSEFSYLSRKLNPFSKGFPQRKLLTLMVSLINLPNINDRNNNPTQYLPENWKKGTFPNSFYCKNITIKEVRWIISLINIETEILRKSLANWIKRIIIT